MPPGIDDARVSAWLADNVDGAAPPFSFEAISGGRSNLTYTVTGGDGRRFVVRRPPLDHVLESAHDVAREHRIITALGASPVPMPVALGVCTDVDVNGAPFYVMTHIEGAVLDSQDKAALLPVDRRRPASEHLIDILADLHALDVDAVGLGDLSRRDSYIERQLRRWTRQWERAKTREIPQIDEVAGRLASRVPAQQGVVIAHGDYRFGNCLTDVEAGRIVGVLDWELCTLGDPLADVGYLGVYWSDPGELATRHNDPSGGEGFPPYSDLLERYAARTGRDLAGIGYYVAFASWRLAVISEGVYARFRQGAMGEYGMGPEELDAFKSGAEQLADAALVAARDL